MITIKNSHEQARMREAGKIVGDTLRFIEPYVKPGVTTAELDQLMENFIRSRGAVPNFKHLYGFPATACISIDEEVVHGVPSERVLREGEIVSVDVGAKIKGFNGDASTTMAHRSTTHSCRSSISSTTSGSAVRAFEPS